jgi:predicted metal-dependent hydrolase
LATNGHDQIVAWYQSRGSAWLRPRIAEWASRLRVEPGATEVADLGHKWGAAAAGGRVRIHWASMQLRPILLDYVLAHELAHLREAHHGPAFWQLLGRVMPDFDERKTELARTGGLLWLGN